MIKLTICYGFGGHYIFSDKAQLSFPVQKQSSKTSSGGLDVKELSWGRKVLVDRVTETTDFHLIPQISGCHGGRV